MRRLAALAAGRISCYLKELGQEELLRRYGGLLSQDLSRAGLDGLTAQWLDAVYGGERGAEDFCGRQEQQRLLLFLRPQELAVTGLDSQPDTISRIRIMAAEYQKVAEGAWRAGIGAAPAERPLFLTVQEGVKLIPKLDVPVISGACQTTDRNVNFAAWEYFSTKYLGEGALNSRELTVKMKLPVGRIRQVVRHLAMTETHRPIDSRTIFRYCYELLDDGRYDNIKRVETHYTYDDLKLEQS